MSRTKKGEGRKPHIRQESPNEAPKDATPEEREEWLKVPRAFEYRQRRKPGFANIMETDPHFLHRVSTCAGYHMTIKEAAAVLRITRQHFSMLIATHEDVKVAWEDGRNKARGTLRMTLWRMAQEDPATARFLAKQQRYLGMEDGATKAAKIKAEAEDRRAISKSEAVQRVMELMGKLALAKSDEGPQTLDLKALPAPKRR